VPDLSLALEECLQAVKEKRNLQDILRRYPHDREELVSLLRLSVELNALGAPAADPAFRLRARNGMLAVAAQRRHEQQRRAFNWLPRRVVRVALAGAAALVPVAAGFTVAAASNSSIPGDPLYGAKLGVERVELAVTLNPAARARLQLQFADTRLQEAQQLYARGRSKDAIALVNQYDVAVSKFQTSLGSVAFDDGAINDLSLYVQQRQQHADESLDQLAGSFKAQGDSNSAAIVAQAQSHVDQAFRGSSSDLQAHQTGRADATHTPKPVGAQR
jgi:ABC-type amino acid transport substrate-binding protein